MKKIEKNRHLKAQCCKIMMLMMILVGCIFALSLVSASKEYNPLTQKVSVKNSSNVQIATIKLDTPLVNYVIRGIDRKVAELTITIDKDYSNFFKKIDLKNNNNNQVINRDITYKIKNVEVLKEDYYTQECTESKKDFYPNGTAMPDCKEVKNTRDVDIVTWTNLANRDLKKGTYTIGLFADVLENDNVEWIPTLFLGEDIQITEFATWQDSMNVNILAYYKLDESTGTICADSSGLGNTANETLETPTWTYGKINNGMYGQDGRMETPINLPSTYSLSFWVNTSDTSGDWVVATKNSSSGSNAGGFAITNDVQGSFGVINLYVYNNNNLNGSVFGTHRIAGDSLWHNIIIISNTTGIRAYVDGVNDIDKNFIQGASSQNLSFRKAPLSSLYGYTGILDEIGVWGRGLTSTEITDLATAPPFIPTSLKPNVTVTLKVPINNANVTNMITFNATIIPVVQTLINATLYVYNNDGSVNTTATNTLSGVNEVNTTFNIILGNGIYKWNVLGCGTNNCSYDASNFTLNVRGIWNSYYDLGLMSYWKLDESTGTNAFDSSKNNMNGTFQSAPIWTNGLINNGVFGNDTSNSRLKTPVNLPQTYSINFWINFIDTSGDYFLGDKNTSTGNGDGFAISNDGGKLNLYLFKNNNMTCDGGVAQGSGGCLGVANIRDGKWHQITMIGNTTGTKVYVDGAIDIQQNFIKGISTQNLSFRFIPLSNLYNYSGYLDEIGTWNRELNVSEIIALNNSGLGVPAFPSSNVLVSLLSPTNNANLNYQAISFNATITPVNENLVNATLYIYNNDGSVNTTATNTLSGSNSLVTNFSKTLTDATYKWNVYACGTLDCNFAVSNNTLTIDATAPSVSIVYPLSTNYTNLVTGINYTFTEGNPDTCWYSLNNGVTNVTITCGNNVTGLTSSQGFNTWTIYANDSFGNSNLAFVTFYVDTINPNVTINSPVNNSFSRNQTQTFSANLSDNLGLKNATLNVYNTTGLYNQTTISLGGVLNYVLNIPMFLAEGFYNWFVSVFDTLGNSAISTPNRTITIDTGNPQIAIVYPLSTNYTNLVTGINYTFTEGNPDTCWYSLNNGVTNVTITCGNNVVGLNSGQGFSTWGIFTNDSAGNYNSSSATFFVDSIKPLVQFVSPTDLGNDFWYQRHSIITNVTASDTNLKNITTYLYNGTQLLNSTTTTSTNLYYNFSFSYDGDYYINSTACDILNNCNSTETRRLRIDTFLPIVNIYFPEDEASFTYYPTLLNFTVQNTGAIDTCWYNTDGDLTNRTIPNCTDIGFVVFNNVTGLHEGFNNISVWANDSVGLYSEPHIHQIFIDTIVPVPYFISPTETDGSYINTSTIRISVVANDTNFASTTINLYNSTNLITSSSASNPYSITPSVTSNGLWNFYATSYDTLGNSNSTEIRNVTIDTINPLISFSSGTLNDGVNMSQNNIFINTTWTEINFANITFNLLASSTNLTSSVVFSSPTYSYSFTGLANGYYSYNVTIMDKAGRRNSTETRRILLDTIPTNITPIYITSGGGITISPAVNNTYFNNSNFTIGANATDNFGIKNITITLVDNESTIINQTTTSFFGNILSAVIGIPVMLVDGIYTWFVDAFDIASNYIATTILSFIVDTQNPIISSQNYTITLADFNDGIIHKLNATITEINLADRGIYFDGANHSIYNINSNVWEYNFTKIINNIPYISPFYFWAIDNASHYSQSNTYYFNVNCPSDSKKFNNSYCAENMIFKQEYATDDSNLPALSNDKNWDTSDDVSSVYSWNYTNIDLKEAVLHIKYQYGCGSTPITETYYDLSSCLAVNSGLLNFKTIVSGTALNYTCNNVFLFAKAILGYSCFDYATHNLFEQEVIGNNKTRYLSIPSGISYLTSINLDLGSYPDLENITKTQTGYSCSGTCFTPTNAFDNNFATSLDVSAGSNSFIVYENYTKSTSKYATLSLIGKYAVHPSCPISIDCFNHLTNSFYTFAYASNTPAGVYTNTYVLPDNCISDKIQIRTSGTCSFTGLSYYESKLSYLLSPTNPLISIGNSQLWSYSGTFNQTSNSTNNFASSINAYLPTCNIINGFCNVPFTFHSDTAGIFKYFNLKYSNLGFTENSQTWDNETTEGANEKFDINVTYDNNNNVINKAWLIYDGVRYLGTPIGSGNNIIYSKTISIPAVPNNTYKNFYWEFNMTNSTGIVSTYQSLNYSQFVKNLEIDDCSVYTNMIYNMTLYEQELKTKLNPAVLNTSIEATLTLSSLGTQNNILNISRTWNNTNPAQICLNINLSSISYRSDLIVSYRADGYVEQFYYIDNGVLSNSTNPIINLYDLIASRSTSFLITYQDENYIYIEGAVIDVQRKYVGDGIFLSVEHAKTDAGGQTRVHLITEDIIYKFNVWKNGVLLYSSPELIALCQASPCQINLRKPFGQNESLSVTGNLVYAFDYNASQRKASLVFSTNDGSTTTMRMEITKADAYENTTIFNDSVITSSGELDYTIPSSIDNATYVVTVYKDGKFIGFTSFAIQPTARDTFGNTGIILSVFAFLLLALMGISSGVATIVFGIIGLTFVGLLTIFESGNILGIGSAIVWLIIAGIIIIVKATNRRVS